MWGGQWLTERTGEGSVCVTRQWYKEEVLFIPESGKNVPLSDRVLEDAFTCRLHSQNTLIASANIPDAQRTQTTTVCALKDFKSSHKKEKERQPGRSSCNISVPRSSPGAPGRTRTFLWANRIEVASREAAAEGAMKSLIPPFLVPDALILKGNWFLWSFTWKS